MNLLLFWDNELSLFWGPDASKDSNALWSKKLFTLLNKWDATELRSALLPIS
jgi:hypothetical protein